MPGDRGLAFVVIGLIGAIVLWVNDGRVPRPAGPQADLAAAERIAPAWQGDTAKPLLNHAGHGVQRVAHFFFSDFREFNAELSLIARNRLAINPGRVWALPISSIPRFRATEAGAPGNTVQPTDGEWGANGGAPQLAVDLQ